MTDMEAADPGAGLDTETAIPTSDPTMDMETIVPMENETHDADAEMEGDHEPAQEAETETSEDRYENQFAKGTTSPIIKIIIGEGRPPFFVHRHVLTQASDYFKACLQSGMQESQSLEVKLKLDKPYYIAFGYFVDSCYNKGGYEIPGEILRSSPIPENASQEEALATTCREQLLLHVKIHLLADQLCAEDLKSSSLSGVQDVLDVALRYTHPSRLDDATAYGSTKWRDWADTTDFAHYRNFCLGRKDPATENIPEENPLLKPEDMIDVLKFIYENTTTTTENYGDSIRKELIIYCARYFGEWRKSKEFMDLIFENREIFDDLMAAIDFN